MEARESQIWWSWPGLHSETSNAHTVGGDTKPLRYRGKYIALSMCKGFFLAYKRKICWKPVHLSPALRLSAAPFSQSECRTPTILSDVSILTRGFLQGWLILSRAFRDYFGFSFFISLTTLLNFKHYFEKMRDYHLKCDYGKLVIFFLETATLAKHTSWIQTWMDKHQLA